MHERELRVHEADKIYLTLQACSFDNRVECLLMKCSDRFSTLEMGSLEGDEIGSFAERSSEVFTARCLDSKHQSSGDGKHGLLTRQQDW
ncbi:MAG: hypothetical protein ICV82_00085 [Nitrososphaera sp.]|nr:hypothetical protein [Nitrososphaera sp.]